MTAAGGGWKYPPPGVPASPAPDRPYLSLQEAADASGKNRRTLQRGVEDGSVAGWASPGPRHLHWFVYADALPAEARSKHQLAVQSRADAARLANEVLAMQRQMAEWKAANDRQVAELVAQVRSLHKQFEDFRRGKTTELTVLQARAVAAEARAVAAESANLELLLAQDELEDAAQLALESAQKSLRAGGRYRRALAQAAVPGHVGDLAGD